MPNGVFRPVAKTCTCSGLPPAVIPRKTLMSPPLVSARKKSPLGAVRMIRGLFRPVAYCSTLKPLGASGHAFWGRATTLGPAVADCVAYGSGRSSTLIWRVVPGFSKRWWGNGGGGGGPGDFWGAVGGGGGG